MPDIRLITSLEFRGLLRRGLKPGDPDLDGLALWKAGGVRVKLPTAAPATREVAFVLSTADLDREGDSIAVDGWDDEDFVRTGGPVLWAHDHSSLPIARSSRPYVAGARYCAVGSFTPHELNEFGDCVFRMLTAPPPGPYLNSCSVGFGPTEFSQSDTGVTFHKQRLMEWSVCPVPANPMAITIARSKGIDVKPLLGWVEHALDLFHLKGSAASQHRAELNRLRMQADGKGRKFFSMLPTLKLPSALPSAPVAVDVAQDAAQFTAMREALAACGTNLSVADAAVTELLGVPAGTSEEQAAADQASLDAIASNCLSGSAGLAAVAQQAISLGAEAPEALAPEPLPPEVPPASRAGMIRTLKMILANAKGLSRPHAAGIRAVIHELQRPAGRRDEPVQVDGVPLPDSNEFSLANFDLSPETISRIIAKVTAEQLMRVTGRVD